MTESAGAPGYSAERFWTERFVKCGHTGELDAQLYAYDQPQRLRAIAAALKRANVEIGPGTHVLDIGCGSGDVMAALLTNGRPAITGIDISPEVVRETRRRFAGEPTVTVLEGHAEDLPASAGKFDLALGINVLQHLLTDSAFGTAIAAICRCVKPGGHVAVMDFSPITVTTRRPASYVLVRSRQEYADAFVGQGCRLVCEYPLPRIGVRLYGALNRTLARLRPVRATKEGTAPASAAGQPAPGQGSRLARGLRSAVLRGARPFDLWLAPFPSTWTDMRILVFQTAGGAR